MQLEKQTVFIAGPAISKLNIKGLEKREGVIVLTPDSLRDIIGNAMDEATHKSFDYDIYIKWKNEYLNQLIKP